MDIAKLAIAGYHRCRQYLPPPWLYHRDYFAIQALPADAAGDIVEARLRYILHTAARHVPWYRRRVRLSDEELANEPVCALLERFPYTDKRAVMESQREFLDERANPRWLAYATSSGSTGLGIGVWRTKRLADIEKAFFMLAWSRYGFSFDKSRYLRIGADAARPAHAPPTRVSGNRLLLSPFHLDARNKQAIAQAIGRFRPRFIHAYPSTAAALTALFEPGELDADVAAILLASEAAEPHQLAAMARLFRCPVSISYGLTERTNLAFAEYRDGRMSEYRFDRLYAWNENRAGEIVGTSLWNDAMPLVRYRTGDYGTIDAAGRCAAIEGREQEFLVDRHGNRIPGLAINIDSATWSFARTYQIRQERPGAITLVLVPRAAGISPAQAEAVRQDQVARWGGLLDIAVEVTPEVERTASGKHRFVVSRLHPNW
ncbi:MAG: AMP-binding protein [Ramlibacter sp.]